MDSQTDGVSATRPAFDASRCTDPAYILQYAQSCVDLYNASVSEVRAKKKLQQTRSFSDQTMYAITTLVDIIGDYVTPRKGALRAWAAFKETRAEDQDPF